MTFTIALALLGAQATTTQATAPQATIVAPASASILRAGTEVPLVMAETITTNGKKLRVGQRVRLNVASPVMLGGSVVIPSGAPAEAEITDVRNKGMWGKSGRIEARVLNVRVDGRLVRLTGTFDDKGVTGTAGVVGAIALVPIAGFFVTGTSAIIPAGGAIKAFLDEDLQIAPR
jgi:ribosome-associated protein YbcJ (S4-like RNA binding protein)